MSLSNVIKQILNTVDINFDEEDLVYVESQLKSLDSADTLLKRIHIKDIVPATVFRVEEDIE